MAQLPDATDHLCMRWAATRRELLGLAHPRRAQEFVGAIRCSLGNVQRHHDGASSFTPREQNFPEVYVGDALLVNLAVKRMPPDLRAFMDLHFTLGRGANRRMELLGIPRGQYWRRVNDAKRFIEGYLAARQDSTHTEVHEPDVKTAPLRNGARINRPLTQPDRRKPT